MDRVLLCVPRFGKYLLLRQGLFRGIRCGRRDLNPGC
jgi:hypothetical protein